MDYSKEKVLVIDDCQLFQRATGGILSRLGFDDTTIFYALSAKRAISLAKQHRFDVVLCDFNLGNGANGLQLFEALMANQYVSRECVFIISTAESSITVFRQFVEFEPDDYIVKPINHNTLQARLPKLIYRKRMLAEPIKAYEQGNYHKVLELIKSSQCFEDDILEELAVLEAKSLANIGEQDHAIALFQDLIASAKDPRKMQLEFARICHQFDNANLFEEQVASLINDPIYSASIYHLLTEVSIHKNELQKASEYIQASVKLSQSNVKRLIFKCLIALALKDYSQAFQIIKTALVEAQNSIHKNEQLYALSVHIICLLSKLKPELNLQADKLLIQLRKIYQKQLESSRYNRLDLLTKTRLALLRNEHNRARVLFRMFEQCHVKQAKNHSLTEMIIAVERASLFFHFNADSRYNQSVKELNAIDNLALSAKQKCFSVHTNVLLQQKSQYQHFKRKTLNEAEQAYKQRNYQQASLLTVSIFEKQLQLDYKLCGQLVRYLNKGWPTGWSKSEASKLALNCKKMMIQAQKGLLNDFSSTFENLAKQLQLPELMTDSALMQEEA